MSANTTELHSLQIERHFDHSVHALWRALTEGALLAQWLLPGDFRAEVGHRFTLKADPVPNWNGVIEGEVLEVQPGVRLVYRMHTQGAAPDGVTTVVTWTLRPTAQGTMLHLEQTGFRPQDEPNFRGAGVVWLRYLERLGHLVNTDTGEIQRSSRRPPFRP